MDNLRKETKELLKRKENITDELWIKLKFHKHVDDEIKEELSLLDDKMCILLDQYNQLIQYQNGNASELRDLIAKLNKYGEYAGIEYYITDRDRKTINYVD